MGIGFWILIGLGIVGMIISVYINMKDDDRKESKLEELERRIEQLENKMQK